jgi:hypothetical protein
VEESSPLGPILVNEYKEIKLNEETWKNILDKTKGKYTVD